MSRVEKDHVGGMSNIRREYSASTVLGSKPLEFSVEQLDWEFKLGYLGPEHGGRYMLWINDTLSTRLPDAPLIEKENIPDVCQSDNLVFLGEVTKRVTFQLFINGLLHQFVADHNCRSQCTYLEVDGKINKQWDGVSLEQLATQPYTFYHLGQKFVLKWVIADEDSELPDIFVLEANGTPLT